MGNATLKQQLIDELNPLLLASEKAITRGDQIEAYALSVEVLELVAKYDGRLNKTEIRQALNNPVAAEIATRLGVQPK